MGHTHTSLRRAESIEQENQACHASERQTRNTTQHAYIHIQYLEHPVERHRVLVGRPHDLGPDGVPRDGPDHPVQLVGPDEDDVSVVCAAYSSSGKRFGTASCMYVLRMCFSRSRAVSVIRSNNLRRLGHAHIHTTTIRCRARPA